MQASFSLTLVNSGIVFLEFTNISYHEKSAMAIQEILNYLIVLKELVTCGGSGGWLRDMFPSPFGPKLVFRQIICETRHVCSESKNSKIPILRPIVVGVFITLKFEAPLLGILDPPRETINFFVDSPSTDDYRSTQRICIRKIFFKLTMIWTDTHVLPSCLQFHNAHTNNNGANWPDRMSAFVRKINPRKGWWLRKILI